MSCVSGLSFQECSDGETKQCVRVSDTTLVFSIGSRRNAWSPQLYEVTMKLVNVRLGSPLRPEVLLWKDCTRVGTASVKKGAYNETQVRCSAVGFQGITMNYFLHVYGDVANQSVSERGFDEYDIPLGAIRVLYNLQYGQACVDSEFNCPAETVEVWHWHCLCSLDVRVSQSPSYGLRSSHACCRTDAFLRMRTPPCSPALLARLFAPPAP